MTHKLVSVAAAFMIALAFSGMASEPEKEKTAVAAAEKWLVLVDGGKHEESWKEAAAYFKTAVKAETLSLFTHIYRTASRQDLPEGQQNSRKLDMVRSAISYIRQHFTEDITVDDICRHLGFSKYYFCREFRRITGRTVTDTINLLRCSHAKSLISSGRCNVSESAERSGFRNLSYFSKTYKRYNGILPSDTEIKL